ncbi:MAG: type 2 isopentenyl-diphosphate Delta-isomerase [Bdellovibrionales bacterium]|nr:type 2 isopentenyl-diphosphate Delta-isomerase [Bdellovibrionales bacterium]
MGMSKPVFSPDSFELAQRKKDHIELTHKSKTSAATVDGRFDYEPLFFTHPTPNDTWSSTFLGFTFDFPIWVSSMTGGIEKAKTINQNLARLCGEFKLGMGLGSCRPLLSGQERFDDFDVRKYLGDQPLFANIGYAQVEDLCQADKFSLLHEMVKSLTANGLIIHLNPLQEWFQPQGDKFQVSPLIVFKKFLEEATYPVIIKEVGQGIGPKSLKALLDLPIAGIEFGAYGGTNFSLLESLRSSDEGEYKKPFIHVGHTALEMVEILNALPDKKKEFIISGGMKTVLDGFELKSRLKAPSVIGMASTFLGPAQEDYSVLRAHFMEMKEALLVAKKILNLKENQ